VQDWVPPSTAASACIATRTMLTSGCWAVSVTPAVWVWKRSMQALGVLGAEPVAHDRRPHPARGAELGHLLEEVVVAVEEERQPRREVVDARPASTAAWTYAMPSARVNAISCTASDPASRM
jgi:hypothetical protein